MNGISQTAKNSSEVVATLSERSKEIGKIIMVIDDIADQTNLLALNAAIEAARAGEQGRGFAVVADEVRKLAERTTKATKEIDGMIKTIQNEIKKALNSMEDEINVVGEGVTLAHDAGSALTEIISEVDKVANMVAQIATSTEEHSTVADHISNDIDGVAYITEETNKSAQQIATVFQDMAETIASIRSSVAGFKISDVTYERDLNELKALLNRVRAAVVGMLTQKDRATIDKQHELIKKLNNDINVKFNSLIHNPDMSESMKSQASEASGVWHEFAQVRDAQLFPMIYGGRLQEAKELALGVQSQRFKKFMAIIDAMLEK
jgi:ABC-type transporter Mla subunit MlaD